jgi:tetratricopeptide (TPR) repeat protein
MMGSVTLLFLLLFVPAVADGQTASQAVSPKANVAGALQDASRALSAGDVDRALSLAMQHLEANAASVPARLVIARAYMIRGDYAQAYDHLRRASQSSPRNVDVLYYLGIAAGRLAEIELRRLAQVAPDSARVHQIRAESLEMQERPHEAAAAYEAAIAREPELIDALLGLAKLRRTALRCTEAIALYKKAEALRPTFEGAYGLGVCLQYEQQDHLAAEQFQHATERDPADALAWKDLGMAEMKLGRVPRAITHLQRAIELRPDMHDAYYALGQIYRAAGDLQKAKEAFAAAERLQQGSKKRGGVQAPAPQRPR